MKPIPYNTGKVKIGSKYVPKQINYMDDDNEFIQSVLLGEWQQQRRAQAKCFGYLLLLIAGIVTLMAVK